MTVKWRLRATQVRLVVVGALPTIVTIGAFLMILFGVLVSVAWQYYFDGCLNGQACVPSEIAKVTLLTRSGMAIAFLGGALFMMAMSDYWGGTRGVLPWLKSTKSSDRIPGAEGMAVPRQRMSSHRFEREVDSIRQTMEGLATRSAVVLGFLSIVLVSSANGTLVTSQIDRAWGTWSLILFGLAAAALLACLLLDPGDYEAQPDSIEALPPSGVESRSASLEPQGDSSAQRLQIVQDLKLNLELRRDLFQIGVVAWLIGMLGYSIGWLVGAA